MVNSTVSPSEYWSNGDQLIVCVHALAVDLGDDVVALQAGFIGGGAFLDILDAHAGRRIIAHGLIRTVLRDDGAPSLGRTTSPFSISWSMISLAVLIGMQKPRPS